MFDVDVTEGRIRAYGEVGWPDEGFTEQSFMQAFDLLGGADCTIQLNSDGGDVFAGQSIYNQIANYPGRVTVEIDAKAHSIASVFPLAADRIIANSNAMMMIHNPWTITIGNAQGHREAADVLDLLGASIAKMYADRTGMPADFWTEVMADETWFDAEKALEHGLIDEIAGAVDKCKPKRAAAQEIGPKPRLAALKAQSARLRLVLGQFDES